MFLRVKGLGLTGFEATQQLLERTGVAGAREMFVEVDHPKAGTMKITGPHSKFTGTKSSVRTPAPLLGQHTDKVLVRLLGLTEAEIAAYREEGVL